MRPFQYNQSYVNPRYTYSLQKIPPVPQKYPEDIQCVLISQDRSKGSIFISNVEAAESASTLDKFQITAVMTCARGYDRNIKKSRLEMYEYFPFDDKESCVIAPYFDKGADFIAKALQKTNILVHCIAGVSRSVSMVLAYLIRDKGMSYEQAYSHIHPNDGFIRQLKKFAIEVSEKKCRDSKSPQLIKHEHFNTPTKRFIQTNQHYRNSQTIEHAKTSDFGKPFSRKDIVNGEQLSQKGDKNDYRSYFQHDFTNQKGALKNRSEQNVKRSARNNSTHVIKSSTFTHESRSKTPQRHQIKKETEHKQPEVFGEHTKYYQTLNQQLNQKIKAIHQKYQKQRQQLTPKRQSYAKHYMYSPSRIPYVDTQTQTGMLKPRDYGYQDESPIDFRGKGYDFIRQNQMHGKTYSFTDNQNKRLLLCGNFPYRKQVNNNYRIVYQDYRSKNYNPYEKNEIKYVGFENNDTRKFRQEEAGRIRKNHNFGLFGKPLY